MGGLPRQPYITSMMVVTMDTLATDITQVQTDVWHTEKVAEIMHGPSDMQLRDMSFNLHSALTLLRDEMETLSQKLSDFSVESDDDRAYCLKAGKSFHRMTLALETMERRFKGIDVSDDTFYLLNLSLLDDIIVFSEDISETLALSASSEFENAISQDLKSLNVVA